MTPIQLAKPYLTSQDAKAAYQTVMSHWLTQGPKVEEFEKQFSTYVDCKYAVAVSNCTTALHLSLIVAGIREGDEIICPSLSFIATANPIRYLGARPVFADVDPLSYNISPDSVEQLITSRTKAIIIVHQLGMPADIDAFKKISLKNKLILIEDAACAAGSKYKGKKIGSHSDLVCFSFHPRKVITTGEGGMITTSNKIYFERLKRLRQHGMSIADRSRHEAKKIIFEEYSEVGYNYRMSDVQAAIGIQQLKKIDLIIKKRRQIAKTYNQVFKQIPCLQIPSESKDCQSNYQTYMLYLKNNFPMSRNKLMEVLKTKGISSRNGIMSIHKSKAYTEYNNIRLSVTEQVSKNGISIPLFAQMNKDEISYVIETISAVILNA